jgi:hypothetical protein
MKMAFVILAFVANSCLTNKVTNLASPALNPSRTQNSTPDAIATKDVNRTEWRAAVFRGLTVGTSLRREAITALGPPATSSSSNNDLPTGSKSTDIDDEYDYSENIAGKLVVSSAKKTGVISTITIYPSNLNVSDFSAQYGKEFVISSYSLMPCKKDRGSSLLIESPTGDIKYLELRSKGIVADVDWAEEKVRSIEFVKGPIASPAGSCN